MSFVACVLVSVIPMKSLPNPMSWRFPLMFSSRSSIVSGLTFKSLIYLELIFVCGIRRGSNFVLLHVDIQFSQLFPMCVLGNPAEDQLLYMQSTGNESKTGQARIHQTKKLLRRKWNNQYGEKAIYEKGETICKP